MTDSPTTQARRPPGRYSSEPSQASAVYSIAPNKPNFPCFWPENEGPPKKQSQFEQRNAILVSPLCGGHGVGIGPLNTVMETMV
jgi:hypothetical protein